MLRLIDRYLLREILTALLAVMAVLLLILIGNVLAETLNDIVRGRLPATLLLTQIALRSVDAVAFTLPLGAFLGVLIALGRLHRNSEMAVLAASGLRTRDLLRPLALVALPATALLAALAFWWSPLALAKAEQLVSEANRSLLVAGLEPGRFVDLPGGLGVIYVGAMDPGGTHFQRLFVQRERDGRLDIVTAANGHMYYDRAGAARYLTLGDGFRVEGEIGLPDFRTMRFERNDIELPEPPNPRHDRDEALRTIGRLWTSGAPGDRAEWHWRIGLPLSLPLLMLLALPLARSAPRQSQYGRIVAAVLGYFLYANLLALGRGWLALGKLPMALGLWWAHAAVLSIALALIFASGRLPLPRARRR